MMVHIAFALLLAAFVFAVYCATRAEKEAGIYRDTSKGLAALCDRYSVELNAAIKGWTDAEKLNRTLLGQGLKKKQVRQ